MTEDKHTKDWSFTLRYRAVKKDVLNKNNLTNYFFKDGKKVTAKSDIQKDQLTFKPENFARQIELETKYYWYPEIDSDVITLKISLTEPTLFIHEYEVKFVHPNSDFDESIKPKILIQKLKTFYDYYAAYKFILPASRLDQSRAIASGRNLGNLKDFIPNYSNYISLRSDLNELLANINSSNWEPTKQSQKELEDLKIVESQQNAKSQNILELNPKICIAIFNELKNYSQNAKSYQNLLVKLLEIRNKLASNQFKLIAESLVDFSPPKLLSQWTNWQSLKDYFQMLDIDSLKSSTSPEKNSIFDDLISPLTSFRNYFEMIPATKKYTEKQMIDKCWEILSSTFEKENMGQLSNTLKANFMKTFKNVQYLLDIFDKAEFLHSNLRGKNLPSDFTEEQRSNLNAVIQKLENYKHTSNVLHVIKQNLLTDLKKQANSLIKNTCRLYKIDCNAFLEKIGDMNDNQIANFFDSELQILLEADFSLVDGSLGESQQIADLLWSQEASLKRKISDKNAKLEDILLNLNSWISSAVLIDGKSGPLEARYVDITEKLSGDRKDRKYLKTSIKIKQNEHAYLSIWKSYSTQISPFFVTQLSENLSKIELEFTKIPEPIVIKKERFGFCYFKVSEGRVEPELKDSAPKDWNSNKRDWGGTYFQLQIPPRLLV